MNGKLDNITLSKHEYDFIIAYRTADINLKIAVNRLLDLPEKIIKFPIRKENTQ